MLQIVFGLIGGGIAGNLGDRLFREPAEVVDFIDVYLPLSTTITQFLTLPTQQFLLGRLFI